MESSEVRKRFACLIPKTKGLFSRLRRLAVSTTLAGASWLNLSGSAAILTPAPSSAPAVPPAISNREKKIPKLILSLRTAYPGISLQHRSHSSHSSHRSHSSHYSSRSAPSAPAPSGSSAAPPQAEANEQYVIITISKIESTTRVLSGQDELKAPFQFVYRDYTKVQIPQSGEFVQIDAWLEKNPNRLPFTVGQKVRVTWKTSDDKTKRIAVKVAAIP